MDELKRFHIKWLSSTAVVIGFSCAFVAKHLPESISGKMISGTVIGALFITAEWFIREKMWRWPIFHRSIDFAGEWLCVTYYETVVRNSKKKDSKKSFEPFKKLHKAVIEQDALKIRIRSSPGEAFNQWESLVMNATPDGISYAYDVKYSDSDDLMGESTGFEKLSILQYASDPKSSEPVLLTGKFSHCVANQKDAFMGTAVFCRSTHLHLIEEEKLINPQVKQAVKAVQDEYSNS